jgi:hypothetical protein
MIETEWRSAQKRADATDQIDNDLDNLHTQISNLCLLYPENIKVNQYQKTFTAICPVNEMEILYDLEIVCDFTIRVESIDAALEHIEDIVCSDYGPALVGYHEQFADLLYEQLGGRQKLVAEHHGTTITTMRGEL